MLPLAPPRAVRHRAMDWFVVAFLKSSLAWLGFGVTLGLLFTLSPGLVVYRPAHAHINLLGFVSMMIFGVAYHVIPRFSGSPLFSRRMAGLSWWGANGGLLLLVTGFFLRPHLYGLGAVSLSIGGMLVLLATFLFIVNIWRTLNRGAA